MLKELDVEIKAVKVVHKKRLAISCEQQGTSCKIQVYRLDQEAKS